MVCSSCFLSLRRIVGRDERSVAVGLQDAAAARGREHVEVRAFARLDDRCEQRALAAHAPDGCGDGFGRGLRDGLVVIRAMRDGDLRVEQAQVVRDLGDGGDRGARAGARRALLERDGGRNAGDGVDVGARHRRQELARVRRERLEKAPLSFGEHHVERERALAGAARAR